MVHFTWPRWLPCPYMEENFKKSSPEPLGRLPWNLACSIWGVFSSPEPKAPGELIGWEGPVVCPSTISNDFSSETIGPIATKFHIQPSGLLGKKNCSNGLGHMTNMAAMPIYGKNLKKSSSPETLDRWPWNLVCSIVYGSTTKAIQIMTLGWPWPILRQGQIWSHRLLYGKKWKWLFFGNYCCLGSQSCFKHLAELVNEVEWVSKVKVILWPWSKVTQISMLKLVFLKKQFGDLEPKFIWKLEVEKEWKFIQMSWVTWPTWPPCPYMVKTLKKLLLQNH